MTKTFQLLNGDWVLNKSNGRPVLIEKHAKIVQDVGLCLTSAKRRNGYGTNLNDLIGRDLDPTGFRIAVQRDVRTSMEQLQRLQDETMSSERTDEERIATIASVTTSSITLGGRAAAKTATAFRLRVIPVRGEVITVAAAVAG